MKNYVSLGIMLTLLNGKRYNAPKLAEKYETSVKTIYRAIDNLVSAGMPIRCISGKGGGYELIQESSISTSFFTMHELCSFISFIKSTNKSYPHDQSKSIEERLNLLKDKHLANDLLTESKQLVFDTETWGSANNEYKSKEIKDSISKSRKILIEYLSENELDRRIIHPYSLVYKVGSWYVYAYCEKRNAFRLFKLSRITFLTILEQKFTPINIDPLTKPWNKDFERNLENIDIKLIIPEPLLEDIKEWLGDNIAVSKIQIAERSQLLIHAKAIYSIGLVHRLMQYSNKIKILEPKKLQDSIKQECEKITNIYN